MNRFIVMLIVSAFMAGTIYASQPWQPLDCSDWVFLEPGLTCTVFASGPAIQSSPFLIKGGNLQIDNAGNMVLLWSNITLAGGGRVFPGHFEIRRFNGQGESVLASIDDRIAPNGGLDHLRPRGSSCNGGYCESNNYLGELISFDPLNGRLLIPLESYCSTEVDLSCPNSPYGGGWWVASIEGFGRLFDILQTYTPVGTTLSFHVPAIPEGLPSADHFDTYWGNVASLPDFTQAHPMACSYPNSPLSIGDFLAVADTSPTPPVGQANYFVTAVTHGAERRYGRQLIGPTMTGRNPALLPVCQ